MRLELTYVKNLKTLSETLKAYKAGEKNASVLELFDACITSAKAIILLYKNLGEAWNELTAYIVAEKGRIEGLKTEFETFKGEINEKVDDVNNYLVNLIRELEARVDAVEEILRSMHKVYIYTAVSTGLNKYKIYDGETEVTYAEARAKIEADYIIFIRYTSSGVTRIYTLDTIEANFFTLTDVYYSSTNGRLIVSKFSWSSTITKPVTYSAKYWELDSLVTDVETLKEETSTPTANEYAVVNVASFWVQDPTTGLYQYELPDVEPTDDVYVYTLTAGGSDYASILTNSHVMRSAGVFATYNPDNHLILNATSVPTDNFNVIVKREKWTGNENFASLIPAHKFIINGV